jgi:hypothetical protein
VRHHRRRRAAELAGDEAMIEWHEGDRNAPKDRRLLLIVTAKDMPVVAPKPDIVIGHWHEDRHEFVALEPPYPRGGTRPALNVKWWSEIPELPDEVDLRPLADEDVKG